MKNERLVLSAREWIDTPWQHNQRCKGAGVDCVQLLAAIALDNNVDLGHIENYYPNPEGDSLLVKIRQIKDLIEIDDLSYDVGSILVFKVGNLPHHVGICNGKGMIHADSSIKKVVEIYDIGTSWKRRLAGVFEVRSVGSQNS